VRKIQEEETVKISIKIRTVFMMALVFTFLGALAHAGARGRALKLVENITCQLQTSPPSTPTSTAATAPASSEGGLGRHAFLISAMLPPPKGFDLPRAEDFLTQNGANFFKFSQYWNKIEPSPGHYDLTNTITNPFTLVIPKYRFKGVDLTLKMIDTNNRTMPADLKNKPFDDPQVEQRFLKMLHMVATAPGVASQVNYILLGNEVDGYFEAHPGELAGFMSLLKASIDQLHQDLPGVKVGTITTFSSLRHPQLFKTLTQYSDFIDYTYYPLAAHWRMRPVSDAPGDLAKMSAAAGNKQFGFTEIGYSASPLSGSSDQQQADFLRTVLQTLDTFGNQVAFVDWAGLSDTPPDLCETYAKSQGLTDVDAMCAYGEHTGLRTYDNQPRPAWNIFVQAMKASGPSSGDEPPSTSQVPAPPPQTGATTDGMPPSFQAKMAHLQNLAQKRQEEGFDMQPVVAVADGIGPLVDQQKFAEAEALVDRALKLLGESPAPEPPAPAPRSGATSGGPPPSLQAKIAHLQKLAQKRQDEGFDMEPVVAVADGIGPLMDQHKFTEAEAQVDHALKLLGDSPTPEASAPAHQSATPEGVPASLLAKRQRIHILGGLRKRQGADVQEPTELMKGYDSLVQQQKYAEAEALCDRVLKLLGDSPTALAAAPPQQPGATPGAVPASLQAKMQRLHTLFERRKQEGADLQPVEEVMHDFHPLMDQQKYAEAEAVVDRALKLLGNSPAPQAAPPPPQAGATPGGVPPSLQAKMARLETLEQKREQEGSDVAPVVAIADGVQPLIEQQKFSEAEALVDRALELVEKGAPAKQAPVELPKKASASDPTYLVYQFMVDSQNPEDSSNWVERLQAEYGRQKPGQTKYVGFGFFVEDMNDDVPTLRHKIESMLRMAEKYEMPVFIQLEGTMFWARRSDGLSANPEAVEWSAFPAMGQKTGPVMPHIWFNWGQLTAFPVPPPCFESPLFQADVKDRLENGVLAPLREALKRWRAGSIDRSYRFAGITVGNEVQMPDYREYKIRMERNPSLPRPKDRATGLEMTDAEMVRGGYCSLYNKGYNADKIAEMVRARFGGDDPGGKNTEAVTTELLNEVARDYTTFRSKILWDGLAGLGTAQKRIYTHSTSAVGRFVERHMPAAPQIEHWPSVAAAVNPYSRPGFTVVRNRLDIPDLVDQMSAAARGTTAFADGAWGAVESYATMGQPGRPQSREEYGVYLDELFISGAKLVSLLEAPQATNNPFTIAAESAGVTSAIKDWLRK
jgi:hypothetical protein